MKTLWEKLTEAGPLLLLIWLIILVYRSNQRILGREDLDLEA